MKPCSLRVVTALIILGGCADDGVSKRAQESCAKICDCVVDSAGPSAAGDCHHQCTSMVDDDGTVDQCEDVVSELGFSECRGSCSVLAQGDEGGQTRDAGTTRGGGDASTESCGPAVVEFRACAGLLAVAAPSAATLLDCCGDRTCTTLLSCVSSRVKEASKESCRAAFTACSPDAGR